MLAETAYNESLIFSGRNYELLVEKRRLGGSERGGKIQ